MRKNATPNSKKGINIQYLMQLQAKFSEVLSKENIEDLARECGFIQRKGKISAYSFVNTLIFNQQEQDQLTLLDLMCDLFNYESCNVSREAIHKKFSPEAVDFLKKLFAQMLSVNLDFDKQNYFSESFFSGINIKDSTKVRLPKSYSTSYPGFGSFNKVSALLNIQYEFDLFSKQWKKLEFTKATRNDQTESKETVEDIQPGSLNLRDLGYITSTYLEAVEEKHAFYLNRLPKVNIYQENGSKYQAYDWKEIDKNMKKKRLPYQEMGVYIGNKKLKTRMVITPVPEDVAAERIRKATQGGKRSSRGYQLSKEFKIKAHYNIYITNVPENVLSTKQVIKAYKVRWNIEMVFKAWKSGLKIDRIKAVKTERMECQLLARFIWILLNSKILQASNCILKGIEPDQICSPFKVLKRLTKYSNTLRVVFYNQKTFVSWYKNTVYPLLRELILEKRLGKPTSNQLVDEIFFS